MLLLRDRLLDVPIMSLQTGTRVGAAMAHIIDPRRLTIVAFYCEGPLIDYSPAILHVSDIREFSSIGFIVDSADNVMPQDDLVRLKEILEFKFELIGKQVVESGGRKLGKVANYTVDSESFFIVKLHVQPGLLRSFAQTELIIDRTQIVEINDKHIVVRRATIEDEQRATMPVIDNPFRKQPGMPRAHGATKKSETAQDAR